MDHKNLYRKSWQLSLSLPKGKAPLPPGTHCPSALPLPFASSSRDTRSPLFSSFSEMWHFRFYLEFFSGFLQIFSSASLSSWCFSMAPCKRAWCTPWSRDLESLHSTEGSIYCSRLVFPFSRRSHSPRAHIQTKSLSLLPASWPFQSCLWKCMGQILWSFKWWLWIGWCSGTKDDETSVTDDSSFLQWLSDWFVCTPWAASLENDKMCEIPQEKKIEILYYFLFKMPSIHQTRWVVLVSHQAYQAPCFQGERSHKLQGQGRAVLRQRLLLNGFLAPSLLFIWFNINKQC